MSSQEQREWTREEVVILVAEYFRTKEYSSSDIVAVYHMISSFLRMREECITHKVPAEKFRDYAGIRMQAGRIRSLDPNTKQKGMTGTVLQKQIVSEYLDNPDKINKEADDIFRKYSDIIDKDSSLSFDDQERQARIMPLVLLKEKAECQKSEPSVKMHQTVQYYRDPYISEYTKRISNGYCQLCGKPAPFVTPNGFPYLESHHIVWLSRGGEDSIENSTALCPNCHKRMHILDEEADVKKLLDQKHNESTMR